jgi:uncharacterized protein (DUF952 family)
MRHVYHLVSRRDWDKPRTGPFKAESLKSEGFIHCSNREQVVGAANRFYEKEAEHLLLTIDAQLLTSLLCDEDSGSGERFPHIYGPIDRQAIIKVEPMRRDSRGEWALPE